MNRFFVRFFLGQVGDVLGELDVSVAAGDVEGVGGGRSGGGGRLAGRSSGRFAGRYVEIFPRVLSRRRRGLRGHHRDPLRQIPAGPVRAGGGVRAEVIRPVVALAPLRLEPRRLGLASAPKREPEEAGAVARFHLFARLVSGFVVVRGSVRVRGGRVVGHVFALSPSFAEVLEAPLLGGRREHSRRRHRARQVRRQILARVRLARNRTLAVGFRVGRPDQTRARTRRRRRRREERRARRGPSVPRPVPDATGPGGGSGRVSGVNRRQTARHAGRPLHRTTRPVRVRVRAVRAIPEHPQRREPPGRNRRIRSTRGREFPQSAPSRSLVRASARDRTRDRGTPRIAVRGGRGLHRG